MEENILIKQDLDRGAIAESAIHAMLHGRKKYFFILLFLVILNQVFINDSQDIYSYIPIVFLIILPFILFVLLRNGFKKAFDKNIRHYKNVSYIFNSSVFKKEGDGISLSYKWEDLKKVECTNKWYLICLNGLYAFVIDKKQLNTAEITDIENLLNVIEPKIKVIK